MMDDPCKTYFSHKVLQVYLRECQLYHIVEDLLAEHDEEELDRQLEPTARGITLRIASPLDHITDPDFPHYTYRKGNKLSSYIRKFRKEQLQSHI
jgi:hypothetical protein